MQEVRGSIPLGSTKPPTAARALADRRDVTGARDAPPPIAAWAEHRERSIFTRASPEFRAAVMRVAVPVALANAATVFLQGDRAEDVYIVDAGEVEISVVSQGGRKLALEIMTKGEVFGEVGFFAGRRNATATALGPARLSRIRRADLMAAITAEPPLALELIDLLCDRICAVGEKLEERVFLPLPIRLAIRLLHLRDKLRAGDGVVPVSQAELADFAGATREGVAKTLAVWRRRGWIGVGRGEIRVLDAAALGILAETADS